MVCNVVRDSDFTVNCPMDINVLVDDIQIGIFTLKAAIKEGEVSPLDKKRVRWNKDVI